MDKKLRKLIDGLIARIDEGQMRVTATNDFSVGEAFVAHIPKIGYRVEIRDKHGLYEFSIETDMVELILMKSIAVGTELYEPTDVLFQGMRHKAMNADEAVDAILGELDSLTQGK